MAFYLSPLVDVNEIDLTTTIPAVATSIGCIILRNTYKGPERKKWLVTSEDDLIETFGKPPLSPASAYRDMLAGAGFFRWGTKLYATRTMAASATFAGSMCTSGTSATFTDFPDPYILGDMPGEDPDNFGDVIVSVPTTTSIFWLIASSRGEWGNNIRVAICDKATYEALNDGTIEWAGTNGTGPAINATDSPLTDNKDFLIIVESKEQGETSYTRKEEWNVSTQQDRVDDEGVTTYAENVINQQSKYIRISLHESQNNQPINIGTAQYQWLTDGLNNQGDDVEDGDIIRDLDLYSNAEEVDVNLFIDSDKSESVKSYMTSICESRLDCMAVLDCRYDDVVNNSGSEVENLRTWRLGIAPDTVDNLNLNTSYAAVYANWLEVYDKWNNKYRWIPTAGHVAGIFARTDDVTDPWFAPAGFQRAVLSNVRRLAWNPTLGERDILYKNGLNPIVSFAGQGKVVFGQKTMLEKNSAFNRINVRRLFIILEKAISTAVVNFLFEPNDDITRLLLLNLIDPFLRDVRSRRGIFDYLIVCDSTNNTPERIDRNELWCDIYVKPTRAAEFIVLNFIATKTGASFTEIAALRAGRA